MFFLKQPNYYNSICPDMDAWHMSIMLLESSKTFVSMPASTAFTAIVMHIFSLTNGKGRHINTLFYFCSVSVNLCQMLSTFLKEMWKLYL